MNKSQPLAYTIKETAELLRIHPDTVRAMIKRGELPCVEYGRKKWVPRSRIEKMFEGAPIIPF